MSRRRRPPRADIAPLRAAGLHRRFGLRQLEQLAGFTDVTRVPAGTVLAWAGTAAHQFTAVIDGEVSVVGEGRLPACAGPGAQFGAVELMTGAPYESTVTTSADTSLILVVFGPAFRWAATASVPA